MKISKLALATITIGLATTACGLGGGGVSSADGDGATVGNCQVAKGNVGPGPLTGEVKGEITFQTTSLKNDFAQVFDPIIADFQKRHPGVTVKWVDDPGDSEFTPRLLANAAACTLPDVVNLNESTAIALTKAGYLLDLDAKAPEAGKQFLPNMWARTTFAGSASHTAMPWYGGFNVLVFNTELMKAAGLDPADPPKDVFGLFDAAEKIAKASGGKYHATVATPMHRLKTDWQAIGVKFFGPDGKTFGFAGDPQAIAWVTRMAELYQAGALPKDTLASEPTELSNRFAAGKLVFGDRNASFLRSVKDNAPSLYPKVGVAPAVEAKAFNVWEGQYVAVAATSKNAYAAAQFATFLTNAENQLRFVKDPKVAIFPTAADALKDPFFTTRSGTDPFSTARKVGAEQAESSSVSTPEEIAARMAENAAWGDAVGKAVATEVQLAMQGDKTPEEALKAAETKANELLAAGQ
ncbi:extracellular solute-binding protein [Nonomuraea sp. NPDC059194]|uniref:extracellular solute-binding protein n=1 Tax=Nonomuraea sp. NPDC059194 TaxID=3346764 RepID=UPI0036BB4DAD